MSHSASSRRRLVGLPGLALAAVMVATGLPATPAQGQETAVASATEIPAADAAYRNRYLPIDTRVKDLLSRMTLEEKLGQMLQAERASVKPGEVTTLALGSLLSGGGSTPAENTPTAWADMIDGYQKEALATRLGIPILYGIDAVHGNGNEYGATIFPHHVGLGATRNPALVQQIGAITAQETRATGPQWVFSPAVTAPQDERWGRSYEGFGESVDLVISMETEITGLQGAPGMLSRNDKVLATAKHFAGDGFTTYGTGTGDYTIDQGVTQTNRKKFWDKALRQYVPAVKKYDVGSIMPSYSSIDWTEDGLGNPINMHENEELITGWLKEKQGFQGIVISDYNGIQHIPGDYATQVRRGVNAGIDMLMEPNDFRKTFTTLKSEVDAGRISSARIDDAVTRILRAKFQLGLFENPLTPRQHLGEVGSAAHHAVARTAAAQSQVLLKNSKKTLPLSGKGKIYVAGSNANSMGNQTGGWTITWQGGSTNVVPGTTILDGIRKDAPKAAVTFSETASTKVPSDATGIVVVGETPYAEGYGDVGGPGWPWDKADNGVPRASQTMELSKADSAAIDKVCTTAKRCVVVVVSGRPVIIPPKQLNKIDSLVAGWLPGSEGIGVADPMFGLTGYKGKLPVTWPRSLAQEPINVGDKNYNPLYRYGHGLVTKATQ
ncbi:glycoside hydrolase family 3 protein [Luteococcus sanguinis]|uniref:beta-glucosidase n=1 Tax=Luteococcus sanguinis TaxID=174038 RepID=A0ABW1X2G8_9ACTN